MHTHVRFRESQRRFFSLLSLKYLYISFSFSPCSVPLLPCFSPFPFSAPPGARPSVSLSPPLCLPSACPPILLPAVCSVAAVCVLLCPFRLPVPVACSVCLSVACARPEAPRRPSVCPAVCRAACLLLVSYQAQNSVTVGTDAPRICPRPFILLSVMCCRVFCCPFRCLSCCLLSCVVWW